MDGSTLLATKLKIKTLMRQEVGLIQSFAQESFQK